MEDGLKLIFLDVDGVLNVERDHVVMNEQDIYFVRKDLVRNLAKIIEQTDARVVLSSTWRCRIDMSEYVEEEVIEALKELKYTNLGRASKDKELDNAYNDVFLSCTPDLGVPEFQEGEGNEEFNSYHEPHREQLKQPENSHRTRTDEIILWLKENAIYDSVSTSACEEHNIDLANEGCIVQNRWLRPSKIKVKNFICIDDMNLSLNSCYRMKSKIKSHLILTRLETGLVAKKVPEAIRILNTENFDINSWAKQVLIPCTNHNCFHKKFAEEEEMRNLVKKMKTKRPVASKSALKRSSLNVKLAIIPSKSKSEPLQRKPKKQEYNGRSRSNSETLRRKESGYI